MYVYNVNEVNEVNEVTEVTEVNKVNEVNEVNKVNEVNEVTEVTEVNKVNNDELLYDNTEEDNVENTQTDENDHDSNTVQTFQTFQTLDIEVLDEEEDFTRPKEGDEQKWLIVREIIDYKNHNNLLKEVEYLKNMVIDMNKLMITQNENINRLGYNVDKMNDSMIFVSKEISLIRGNKYSYIKDYLFPALRLVGTYTPFIMLMASKTGIASSTLSFLFFKIFS